MLWHPKKIVSALVGVGLLTSVGCASNAGNGALIGGAAGAGAGALLAGPRHAGGGALLGGAVGALTGAVIGSDIDRQQAARAGYYRGYDGPYDGPVYYNPPPRVVVVGPAPGPLWVEGHWAYHYDHWVWVPGHWA